MKIPYIDGDWRILFKPEKTGNYINDHTIIKAHDGKYHLFGITSFEGGAPNERYFAHGATKSLDTPMSEEGRAIDRGTLAWAPCVVRGDNDYYYMYYGPSPSSLSISIDLYEWMNYKLVLNNETPMGAHRDHFVMKINENEYLMYVVGIKDKRGCVSLFHSSNLLEWDFCGYALTSGKDAPLNPAWGAMESPFVIKIDEYYYLFITYTDCSQENYNNTLVFTSFDPKSFGEYNGGNGGAIPITTLSAHAPEIKKEGENYYITTCGWNGYYAVPNKGCVSIAPLKWKDVE